MTLNDSETTHIIPSWRGILVDWLIEIVQVFDLSPRTAYLAMGYLDKFFVNGSKVRRRCSAAAAAPVSTLVL